MSASTVEDDLSSAFSAAGVTGWLHARAIDHEGEVSVGGDEAVVLTSVFKVPLLVALHREAAAGRVALDERIRLRPADRTAGMTGVSTMRHDVELSLGDLGLLMITVSDNAAADAVVDRIGFAAVQDALDAAGMDRTWIGRACRDVHADLAADLAAWGRTHAEALADAATLARLRVLQPDGQNRSTPRELTGLLAAVWRDEPAPPAACREVRRALRLQVWPHRLASGFPDDTVGVAGKTGTLPPLRSEIGVVEHADGRRYAVAVFTRSSRPVLTDPAADAVIGAAARRAVDHLAARAAG